MEILDKAQITADKSMQRVNTLQIFKIKPTLALGNKALNYPGYIDIHKEVSADFLRKLR